MGTPTTEASRSSDAAFFKRTVLATAVVAATAILLWLVWRARLALLVIYVSALVAAGVARPISALAAWQPRRGYHLPRWAAASLIYGASIAFIGVALALVLGPFLSQADQLSVVVPQQFDRFQDVLRHHGLVSRKVTLQEAVQNVPRGDALASLNSVLTAGFSAAGLAVAIGSVIVLSYYMAVQGEGLSRYFLRWIPELRQRSVERAVADSVVRVGRWLEGTILIGGIVGGVTATALAIMGVPYFFVVGLVSALGEAIPMVGPVLAGVVAVAAALTVSPQLALLVFGFFVIVHEIEANVLVPWIMGDRVGVGAIAVMCGLLIGWELTGVVGALVAVPTVAILTTVARQFASARPLPASPQADSRAWPVPVRGASRP